MAIIKFSKSNGETNPQFLNIHIGKWVFNYSISNIFKSFVLAILMLIGGGYAYSKWVKPYIDFHYQNLQKLDSLVINTQKNTNDIDTIKSGMIKINSRLDQEDKARELRRLLDSAITSSKVKRPVRYYGGSHKSDSLRILRNENKVLKESQDKIIQEIIDSKK